MSLDWIYWAISWILLRWHGLWDAVGVPATRVVGTNWAWILAIIFLVITLRVLMFPLFVKYIKSQRAMQALQPQVTALREKYKGDREGLQREVMELYRKEKANPLLGCIPMLPQIPVFLGLFHVLNFLKPGKSDEFKTLYGWDLAHFEDALQARLFNAPIAGKFGSSARDLALLGADGTTVKIVAAVLVAIMIITTYLSSKQMILKTGWSEDPQQRMIQKLMLYGIPASLLFSGAIFPIGVIIYWVVNNLFSLGQQQWVLSKYPPPASGKTTTPVKSTDPEAAKALAPRPGAKPAHPKKGGGKRQG
ncbi:membrane protein insertase YidC [Pilimelia columellifera]|uniref:Membrane protein insertase YidC n=1 Tax=Pilimelia columellifera subsp. columellifera TaxID=706583 RepID=A0ABP6A8X5_9ACTN